MTTATATEVQNNFGKFLKLVQDGQEVVIMKNGNEVARLISKNQTVSFLSDSLVGVLSSDADEKSARAERMMRYENSD
ncbi:MAG: type II toxin-antitoxin system prevent-host-death family antitoxin [Clostridia bacterium]|nr:type II toxin-antitoxin system prevent-host-death family antitoxin [Clostridia bacterium]